MDKLFCTSCTRDKPKDGFVKGKNGRWICASCVERIAKANSPAHRGVVKNSTRTLKNNSDVYTQAILKRCHNNYD